jgi:hypothetical protein
MPIPTKYIVAVLLCTSLLLLTGFSSVCQTAEIFIPLDNRSEIKLRPQIDTLINGKEYRFKIRVQNNYNFSQFLFDKGLAIVEDTVLRIIAGSRRTEGYDTSTLKVIIKSTSGSQTILFQKKFVVKILPVSFPTTNSPKQNIIKLNEDEIFERNKTYKKQTFVVADTVRYYNNEEAMLEYPVKAITITFTPKYGSPRTLYTRSNTFSSEMLKEIKRLRNTCQAFVRFDVAIGNRTKSVYNRIYID